MGTNKKTKKIWSLLFTFTLVICQVVNICPKQAKAGQTEESLVVYVAAQGESSDGKTTVDLQKTAVQVTEGQKASDAIKKALDTSAYKDNYTISEYSWGLALDSIGGLAQTEDYSCYWSFCVNNEAASVGIGTYGLKDQDKISLIYCNASSGGALTQCSCYADDTTKNPSESAQKTLEENAGKQQDILGRAIYKEQFENGSYVPGIEDADGLYSVFSLARSNFSAERFYDAVYAKISAQLSILEKGGKVYDTANDKDITSKTILQNKAPAQYYAKIALCAAALGKNPANINGVNLIEKLASKNIYEKSSIYSRESMILLAADAAGSAFPEGSNYLSRAELVNAAAADVENQIATSIQWNALDSAAMAIQALAPYAAEPDTADIKTEEIDKKQIREVCQKVLSFLGNMQGTDGTYGKNSQYPSGNAWTLAQTMITVGAFGISPVNESPGYDFIKNGKTVFDASAAFIDTETGTVDNSLMGFQPEQLLRGLNACLRSASHRQSIFLTGDAAYTAKDPSAKAITPDMVAPIADQPYTGKAVRPKAVIRDNGKKLTEGKDYTVQYQNNIKTGTASIIITGTGNYILSQKITFRIVKKEASLKKPTKVKAVSKKSKTLTVTFQKVNGAKQYTVEISKKKNFKKTTKKTVKTTTATFTKLSKGKKYYVRVKAHKGKISSAYSKTISKKIK